MTRRCALLVNPTAGKGRHQHLVPAVQVRLAAADLDVTRMQGADGDEAADLARQAVDDGYDLLVVMGGDGIVHLAVQSVAMSETALGVIATGTGNDVARYLDLPRRNPVAAAEIIGRGVTRRMDLARAGTTYYVTVLAAGFDSLVNERANAMTWPTGQMRYNLATLAELRVFNPLSYTLELDGERRQLQAMLVAVGNGPSYGGGLRICEGALLDDGQLDVVIIKPISKPELLRVYPKLFKGTHVTHRSYEHHRVSRVSIAVPGVVAYADGERLAPLPLTVEAVPAALTVCVPSR
ncbi:MAG: YegS/Rv2252/BmrU family lipid kinase [Nocardioidaceae bacterium]